MGEADDYYTPNQRGQQNQPQYNQQYNQQWDQQQYYQQQPPPPQASYAYQGPPQDYQQQQPPPPPPPANGYGQPGPHDEYNEKPSFEQTFKVDKPKWNDKWAGILVRFAISY